MINNQINYLYEKPRFSNLGFSIIATVLILTFYQASLFLGTFLINTNENYSDLFPLVLGVCSLLFLLAPTLLAAKISSLPFKELFRLKKPDFNILFLSLFGILTFQIFVVGYSAFQESLIPESLKEFYAYYSETIRNLYESILGGNTYLDYLKGFIIGATLPAICEEALFRGFFQRSLEENLKPLSAILISGILFGLIHMNPIDLIPLILIGIYLSVLAYYSGSIWVPISVHFLNNFWALNVMYFSPLKALEEQSKIIPIHFSLSLLLLGALSTLIILFFIIKYSEKIKSQKVNSLSLAEEDQ